VDLKQRTKSYALRIIKVYTALSKSTEAQVLGKQVLRSGTSIGAHYREALRARSDAEYISKMETALQELEETTYWLELLIEAELLDSDRLQPLLEETNQIIAIFVTCVKSTRKKGGGRRTNEGGGKEKREGGDRSNPCG
jgi:four helix bundle protein